MIQKLMDRVNGFIDEIEQIRLKIYDFINNPLFQEIQGIIVILDSFLSLMEEFKNLGFFEDVQDFNDFMLSIIENAEEILTLYPSLDEHKEDFYKIGTLVLFRLYFSTLIELFRL